jgi:putative phosphoesterase
LAARRDGRKQGMSRGRWTRSLPLEEQRLRVDSPQRVGVISDTHVVATRYRAALDAAIDVFRRAQVTMILHAGDAGSNAVLQELEEVAPVVAVRGNADPHDLIEALPDRVWIEIGQRRLLLMHGHHGKTAKTAARAAVAPDVDIIVFGHSHQPLIERHETTILFNPGSPTERRWNPHFGIGLLAISDEAIEPELILFDDARHLANVNP